MTFSSICFMWLSLVCSSRVRFLNWETRFSMTDLTDIIDWQNAAEIVLTIAAVSSHCWSINFCRLFILSWYSHNMLRLSFSSYIFLTVFSASFRLNINRVIVLMPACLTIFVCLFSDNSSKNYRHTVYSFNFFFLISQLAITWNCMQ